MAWAGAQDHLANQVQIGRGPSVASANIAVCGTFNAGRGDKIVEKIHTDQNMCPNCLGQISRGARWPGV